MADLGVIGVNGLVTKRHIQFLGWYYTGIKLGFISLKTEFGIPWRWRCLHLGSLYNAKGVGKELSQGNPAIPSIKIEAKGRWRFRWKMLAGPRTLTLKCKQEINVSPRPSVIIKANPEIGINSDITTVATSGTDWVTIGPIAVNPTIIGATWVELHANADYQNAVCYFDNIKRT